MAPVRPAQQADLIGEEDKYSMFRMTNQMAGTTNNGKLHSVFCIANQKAGTSNLINSGHFVVPLVPCLLLRFMHGSNISPHQLSVAALASTDTC